MTSYESELVIDFGEVGYRQPGHPFKIRLKAEALWALIKDAMAAHRIYELMLIERPGDVWDYVSVVIEDAPPDVFERIAYRRSTAARGTAPLFPEPELSFHAFDQLFYWTDDDRPEDEAWLSYKDSSVVRAFAQQLLAAADAARSRLEWVNDPLIRHTVRRVRSNEHPYRYLSRHIAIQQGRRHTPNAATHTTAFYKQLATLLSDPDLASVAYRGRGDYGVLRALATEQRARASRTGHEPGHALHLSALTDYTISNDDWGSEIWFFDEGLGHGDLFIEGGGLGSTSIKKLVQGHRRVPGRYILSTADEGDIDGFVREAGDGFVLYRKETPDTRRVALERIDRHSNIRLGPVMVFGGRGTTLFDHDKTVVLIGESISAPARAALGEAVADWQQHGGDPILVVFGDAKPFEVAGCRGILQPEVDKSDAARDWLRITLRTARPWIDAIVALDSAEWSSQVLADRVRNQEWPWSPWVVTHGDTGALRPNLMIEGDLTQFLLRAHARARTTRPRWL